MFQFFIKQEPFSFKNDAEWIEERKELIKKISEVIEKDQISNQPFLVMLVMMYFGFDADKFTSCISENFVDSESKLNALPIAEMLIDQVEAQFNVENFVFSRNKNNEDDEIKKLRILLALRVSAVIFALDAIADGVKALIKYRPHIISKKNSLIKQDKWGDEDRAGWDQYLQEFAAEKLNMDIWDRAIEDCGIESSNIKEHIDKITSRHIGRALSFRLLDCSEEEYKEFMENIR